MSIAAGMCNSCCSGTPPTCASGMRSRSIFLWRYIPGYRGFNASGIIHPYGGQVDTTDPITWALAPMYSTMVISQAADTSPIATRARSGGIATITLGGSGFNPFLMLGKTLVDITGMFGTGYNGSGIELTVSGSGLTYPSAGPDEATTADVGTLTINAVTLTSTWTLSGGIRPNSSTCFSSHDFYGTITDNATIVSSTSCSFNDGSSTLTVSNPIDFFHLMLSIWDPLNPTLGIGALTSNFSSLSFWDPAIVSFPGLGTYSAAWTFNDACVLPGPSAEIFCSVPPNGTGLYADGYDTTGADYSSYDGAVVSVPNTFGDPAIFGVGPYVGLPNFCFNTGSPPPGYTGPFFQIGYPMAASWQLMFGLDISNQMYGLGTSWIGACVSQALYTGPYKFNTWVLFSDGTAQYLSTATGGTGDGVTPIDIPIPPFDKISNNIPSSFYTRGSVASVPWPIGKITCLAPA